MKQACKIIAKASMLQIGVKLFNLEVILKLKIQHTVSQLLNTTKRNEEPFGISVLDYVCKSWSSPATEAYWKAVFAAELLEFYNSTWYKVIKKNHKTRVKQRIFNRKTNSKIPSLDECCHLEYFKKQRRKSGHMDAKKHHYLLWKEATYILSATVWIWNVHQWAICSKLWSLLLRNGRRLESQGLLGENWMS